MKRCIEEMKLWLFDLAHGNLNDEAILKGFIKHYALHNHTVCNVQDDIVFHSTYGEEGVKTALSSLNRALEKFAS